MATKNFRAWTFPMLSLGIGFGMFALLLLHDERFIPFMGFLMGPPDRNSVPAYAIPSLLATLFGFLRPKPREIWSYGFLMWAPQVILVGGAWALSPKGWASGVSLVIAVSALLGGVVGVVASYAGFALRKIVNKSLAVPEQPPTMFRK
jgi:hypothetical protein